MLQKQYTLTIAEYIYFKFVAQQELVFLHVYIYTIACISLNIKTVQLSKGDCLCE